MKQCRKCLTVKSSKEFQQERRHRDGLASWCRHCCNTLTSQWRKKHQKHLYEYGCTYRQTHPNRKIYMRKYLKRYYQLHKDIWNFRNKRHVRQCIVCHSLFKTANKQTRYCSRQCQGANLKWAGNERYKIWNGKWEHRLVMEQKLGRKLRIGEVVHHVNGNQSDNRPENLQLFPSTSKHFKHHHQIRVERESRMNRVSPSERTLLEFPAEVKVEKDLRKASQDTAAGKTDRAPF